MAAAFLTIQFVRALQVLNLKRRKGDLPEEVEWLEVLAAGIEIWPPAALGVQRGESTSLTGPPVGVETPQTRRSRARRPPAVSCRAD